MVIFIILSIKAAFFFCFPRDHNFGSTMQPYVKEPKRSSAVFRSFLVDFHVLHCATGQWLVSREAGKWVEVFLQRAARVSCCYGCRLFSQQLWAAVRLRNRVCGKDKVLLCGRSKNKQAQRRAWPGFLFPSFTCSWFIVLLIWRLHKHHSDGAWLQEQNMDLV